MLRVSHGVLYYYSKHNLLILVPSHTAEKLNSCPIHLFQSCNFVWCHQVVMHSSAAFTHTVFSKEVKTANLRANRTPCWSAFFPLDLVEGSSLLWGQSQMRKMVKKNLLDYRRESAAEVTYREEEPCSALPGSIEGKPAQQISSNSLLITSPILYSVAFLRASPIPGTPRSYHFARHYFFSSPFSPDL